jgi:hypothetical protein
MFSLIGQELGCGPYKLAAKERSGLSDSPVPPFPEPIEHWNLYLSGRSPLVPELLIVESAQGLKRVCFGWVLVLAQAGDAGKTQRQT